MVFQPGDQFVRRDLDGVLDNQRVITIFNISVTGELQFRLDMVGQGEPSLLSIPMDRAEYLWEQDVWVSIDELFERADPDEIRHLLPLDQFTSPAHRASMGFGEAS